MEKLSQLGFQAKNVHFNVYVKQLKKNIKI